GRYDSYNNCDTKHEASKRCRRSSEKKQAEDELDRRDENGVEFRKRYVRVAEGLAHLFATFIHKELASSGKKAGGTNRHPCKENSHPSPGVQLAKKYPDLEHAIQIAVEVIE